MALLPLSAAAPPPRHPLPLPPPPRRPAGAAGAAGAGDARTQRAKGERVTVCPTCVGLAAVTFAFAAVVRDVCVCVCACAVALPWHAACHQSALLLAARLQARDSQAWPEGLSAAGGCGGPPPLLVKIAPDLTEEDLKGGWVFLWVGGGGGALMGSASPDAEFSQTLQ